jgi:NADH dehydrogenase FAD-containing subunit
MTRVVVLGGGFGGVEVIRGLERKWGSRVDVEVLLISDHVIDLAEHLYKLVGLRKQVQVALDWALARFFPRDSAIMRQPPRCAVCASHARSSCERDVA